MFKSLLTTVAAVSLLGGCQSRHVVEPLDEPFRVLLLGDSISIGYTPHVREALAWRAVVVRPTHAHRTGDPTKKGAENCEGTNKGVKELDRWLAIDGGRWDVIHFNFGLHDLKRVKPDTGKNSNDPTHPHQASPEAYRAQLLDIGTRLKATGARVVFATTTPVPPGDLRPYREPQDSVQYNAIAKEVMAELDIPVNDLFEWIEESPDVEPREANVHFTKEGSRALGVHVADVILEVAGLAK